MRQEVMPSMYQVTYLSQPFNTSKPYPGSFDEFINTRIGHVRYADIPTRLKEKHKKIWGDINVSMDCLTTPLSDSMLVAAMLYVIEPYVNAKIGGASLTVRADLHHAFVRLMEIWDWFEKVLERWAKTEQREGAIPKDGLSLLEEARFLPVLHRFNEAMQRDGDQLDLVEVLEEFVKTSKEFVMRAEVWLRTGNYYR